MRTHGFVIAKRFRGEAEKDSRPLRKKAAFGLLFLWGGGMRTHGFVIAKRFRSEAEKDPRPLRKKAAPSGCFFCGEAG